MTPIAADAALGGALLFVATLELVRSSADFNRAAALAAAVPIAGSLAFRRRLPLTTVLVVLAVNVVHRIALGHPAPALADPPNSFALATAWLIAVYSVAAYGTTVAAAAGLAAAAATTLGFTAACGCQPSVNDFLAALLLSVAVPWLGGFARARQAASIAARREAERERVAREHAEAEAVAAERGRLARELHDIVAHALSVIVVQAAAERRQVAEDATETRSVLATIEDAGRTALTELRRLLGVLRAGDDAPLTPQPRLADLERVLEVVRQSGIDASLVTVGDVRPLAPGIELSAYRVAQEALTNVVKHADASQAQVTVRYQPDALEVEIVDNGGPNVDPGEAGYGLVGMRERVNLVGGSFSAAPVGDAGFRVIARMPVESS